MSSREIPRTVKDRDADPGLRLLLRTEFYAEDPDTGKPKYRIDPYGNEVYEQDQNGTSYANSERYRRDKDGNEFYPKDNESDEVYEVFDSNVGESYAKEADGSEKYAVQAGAPVLALDANKQPKYAVHRVWGEFYPNVEGHEFVDIDRYAQDKDKNEKYPKKAL